MKSERKKSFPHPLVIFTQGKQTKGGGSLKFNINTDQTSGAQIHSSIHSFIHIFSQLLIEYHYMLSTVLSTEYSMVILKSKNPCPFGTTSLVDPHDTQ